MKRWLLPLSVLAVVVLLRADATPARACSVSEDYDVVDDAEILVAGRLTGWEILGEHDFEVVYSAEGERFVMPARNVPFVVNMEIDRVFKGKAPRELEIEANSLDVYDHEPRYVWTGAHGACGAFGFDPTDKYVIVSLSEGHDGRYSTWLFGWVFVGDGPAGEEYERALDRLESGSPFPHLPNVILVGLAALAFLGAVGFLWRPSIASR